MVDFPVSFFEPQVEDPRAEQVPQWLSGLRVYHMQRRSYELARGFTLDPAFVAVHSEKRNHQNTGEDVETHLKHEELELV